MNEILSSSTAPLVDAIELRNNASFPVDISGWYLTDDPATPCKYRIPARAALQPGELVVFDETQFNPQPGIAPSFSLSSLGDQVYLFSADTPNQLTGYSHGFSFTGARDGVSYGRYVNSVGEEQLTPQTSRTLGAVNAGPTIGPVVISEIHFHPLAPEDEFIELRNRTANPVPLYDPEFPTNTWLLSGLNFSFPPGITLPPHGFLLLVGTNGSGFRTRFSVPTEVSILEYAGNLQNGGERLRLEAPDRPTSDGVPYYPVDVVRYSNTAPWPTSADGAGDSLQRLELAAYADDPIRWNAGVPTPGAPFPGAQPLIDFAIQVSPADGQPELSLFAESHRTFTLRFTDNLENPVWHKLVDLAAQSTNRWEILRDPAQVRTRFYRVVTPAQP